MDQTAKGWREIAAFFCVSEQTCQNWEWQHREFAKIIKRTPSGRIRASVSDLEGYRDRHGL